MKRFFSRFRAGIWVYLAVVLTAAAISALAGTLLGSVIRQRQDAEILSRLRIEAGEFDTRYKSLNTLLTMSYQRLRTQKIINTMTDLTDADRYVMYQSRQSLADIADSYANPASLPMEDFLLFFTRSGLSITPATVYTRQNLCSLYFRAPQSRFDEMLDAFLSSGRSQSIQVLEGEQRSFPLFLRRFTLLGSRDYIIGMAVMTEDMFRFDNLYGGLVYVAAADGQLFSAGGQAAALTLPGWESLGEPYRWEGGGHSYQIFSVSASSGYRLAACIPLSTYNRPLQTTWGIVLVLAVLLAAVACSALRQSRKREWQRMSHLGSLLQIDAGDASFDFEVICQSLGHLVHQNSELKQENEQAKTILPYMRSSFVRMLMLGNVPKDDLPGLLAFYRIPTEYERFRVLLLQLDDQGVTPQAVSGTLHFLMVALSSGLECALESCVVDDYTVGVLLMYHPQEKQLLLDSIYRQVERLTESMVEQMNLRVSTGLGRSVSSLKDCPLAYHSARMVLLCSSRDGLRGLNPATALSEADNERLMGILHAMRQGNTALCLRLFDDLFQPDEEGNQSEPSRVCAIVLLNLFDDAVNGSAKLTRLFAQEDITGELSACITLGDILGVIRGLLERACACMATTGEDRVRLLIHRAVQLIQQRYTDPSLSQTVIADELGLSTTVLSAKFKEVVGVNMSQYLRNLRLDHTRRLLLETGLTLSDIAEQTGFGSLKTMYRVFKADTGLTPGQYRELRPSEAPRGE